MPDSSGPYVPDISPVESELDQAIALVRAGLQLVLIHRPVFHGDAPTTCTCERPDCTSASSAGKHPIQAGWQRHPLTTEQELRDALIACSFYPNIGIVLGDQPGGSYLVAIDVDSAERMAVLEAELGSLPDTAASESARGKKLFFSIPIGVDRERLKNVTGIGGEKGVDLKVKGGQVVAPPSIHARGSRYIWARTGRIAELPGSWLLKVLAAPVPPKWASSYTPALMKNDERAQKRARSYLEKAVISDAELISHAGIGSRNNLFYESLCRILPLAHSLSLSGGHEYAVRELSRAALASGLGRREVEQSVRSAEKWVQESGANRVPFALFGPEADSAPGIPSDTVPSPVQPPAGIVAALVDEPEWRKKLIIDKGQIMPIAANVATILRYHPIWEGVIVYDDFAESPVKSRPAPWHTTDAPVDGRAGAGEWTDGDTVRLMNWLVRNVDKMSVSSATVEQALHVVAESKVIHPVRDYLQSLTWDGTERVDRILPTYFGTEDTPYSRGVGRRWMISAVARVMRPGCQADCTLIVESKVQGTGKSSTFRNLVPVSSWYCDTGLHIGDKDSYQNLRNVWIYGLDELANLRKTDVAKVRNFLTATKDRYRPSYGRRAREYVRQNVFCGSTNEEDNYFTDRTGNRRFWPNKLVRDADPEALERDRDQIWAETFALFLRGEKWHVNTNEFRELCEGEQAARVQSDPWEVIVAGWLTNPVAKTYVDGSSVMQVKDCRDEWGGVLTKDVLVHAIGKRIADITRADEMRVAEVLIACGWAGAPQRREFGVRVRRYYPVSQMPTERHILS